jgi:hypothetical protein
VREIFNVPGVAPGLVLGTRTDIGSTVSGAPKAQPIQMGKFGPVVALKFNGTDDYAQPAQSWAEFGTGAFSVTFLISAASGQAAGVTVMGNNKSGVASGWLIYHDGTNKLLVNTNAGFGTTISTNANVLNGTPRLITLTRSSVGTYNWYIDGAQDASTTASVYDVNSGFLPLFGAQRIGSTAQSFCNMYLGPVVTHSRAIALSEHQLLNANYWQLFAPTSRQIYIPIPASGGVDPTGTSNQTINLTTVSAGTVAVVGVSVQTINITSVSTGLSAAGITGTSSANINLTTTAAGTVAITSTSAQTFNLTTAAAGTVAVTSTSAQTINITSVSTGLATASSTGTSNVTISITSTSSATVAISGNSAQTINLTTVATGITMLERTGTSSYTFSITSTSNGVITDGYAVTASMYVAIVPLNLVAIVPIAGNKTQYRR